MPLYTIATFAVRPEACQQAEAAMHEVASRVRRELADSTWTVYRDGDAPYRFVAMSAARRLPSSPCSATSWWEESTRCAASW